MFLFTAIIMMILTGAEIDLFVPSFPQLQHIFGLTPFMVELTLSVNLIAHCITALVAGSLGDKYGRKPIIIIGLVIFIIGSICCVYAEHYPILLFGRLLQGIGISGPAVLTYVLISDLYPVARLQHLMGMINGALTIAMASAPVLGSYINLWFNWRGNFLALLILGIFCLLLCLLFVPNRPATDNVKISFKDYSPVFKSRKAMLYLISLCFAMQSYWVFIGMSPILYIEDLGVTLQDFGLYQGAIAAVFATSSLTGSYFIKRFGPFKCFIISSYIIGIFFILNLMITILVIKDPLLITITMLFQAVGMSYPINILWPLAIDSVENAKGRVGAIIVSLRLILSAIAIESASYFYNGSFLSIGITICITLIISAITCYLLFNEYRVLQLSHSS